MVGTQARNLEAGTEAEVMENCSLLACYPQVTYHLCLYSPGPSPYVCAFFHQLAVKKMPPQDYLVGNRLTRVDIHLLEVLLYVEEFDASLLTPFPLLKVRPPQRGSHTHASENTWWD